MVRQVVAQQVAWSSTSSDQEGLGHPTRAPTGLTVFASERLPLADKTSGPTRAEEEATSYNNKSTKIREDAILEKQLYPRWA